MTVSCYTPIEAMTVVERTATAHFLFTHLEQYGDTLSAIENAIDYALVSNPMAGGFVLVSREEERITGAVVMNCTGMKEYIPENILVYIAVDKDYRGKGIGRVLMQEAIRRAEGDIALHVEPDNPARLLYEKLNFTSKYLEMRLKRKN